MDWMKAHLFALLLGAIPVGAIAFLVVQYAKRAHGAIDAMPSYLKVGAAFVASAAITALFAFLHVPINCAVGTDCLDAIDVPTAGLMVQAVLATIASMLIHKGSASATP